MKRKFYIFLFIYHLVGIYINIHAQLYEKAIPVTLNNKNINAGIEYLTMPEVDINSLLKEDKLSEQFKDIPWRFGKNFSTDINPERDGTTEILSDGSKLWRVGIICPGALSINFLFDKYKLPEGARLFLYSPGYPEILGAFTSHNNQENEMLATSVVSNDTVIIEYYEPANVTFKGLLNLGRITHGYKPIINYDKDFGDSGPCHVNPECPAGDPIRKQIRSVGRIIVDGNKICSGALINNTRFDGTPYFFTANHCLDASGAVVVWFNWQSPACSDPSESPSYNTMSGVTQVATSIVTDFWLFRLNEMPPPDYNVYLSGWDRTEQETVPGTVYGVHHPQGDIKKLCWSNEGVTTTDRLSTSHIYDNYWRILRWSDGTSTEDGSSGSPLINSDGRIIGQLSDGLARCGNTKSDWYGKLSESWTGEGTLTSRLSSWLDPDNTGEMYIDGYDPYLPRYQIDAAFTSVLIPDYKHYDSTLLNPQVIITNEGEFNITSADISYIINNDTTVGFTWSGDLATDEVDTVVLPGIILKQSEYIFKAFVSVEDDENNKNDTLTKTFEMIDCDSVSIPFKEGFNIIDTPLCWNMKTVVTSNTVPSIYFLRIGLDPVCNPTEGSRLLLFNSFYCLSGSQMRISSPPVSTKNHNHIEVTFDWHHDNEWDHNKDRVIIQYSFDTINWISVDSLLRHDEILSGWHRKEFKLPEIVNDTVGVYIGLLFISDWGGNCHMDNLEITGRSLLPHADFEASPLTTQVGDTVLFSDLSVGQDSVSWEWEFGDGASPETASGFGPHKVQYLNVGKKTVTLTVDEVYQKTKTEYLTVVPVQFGSPTNLVATTNQNDVNLKWNSAYVNFSDGFESGNFIRWYKLEKGNGVPGDSAGEAYWQICDFDPVFIYNGKYSAYCNWGSNINTWLILPEIFITESTVMSFMWKSSYYWHVIRDRGDLFVIVSLDTGNTWEPYLWTFGEIGVWDNVWNETILDLTGYAGNNLMIAFQVLANENGNIGIDNVFVGNTTSPEYVALESGNSDTINTKSENKAVISEKPALQTYSIYRNDEMIAQTRFTSYMDTALRRGVYRYYVTASYIEPGGESGASNRVEVTVIDDGIRITKSAFPVIFPNPSGSDFNFEVEDHYILTVFDIKGNIIKKENITPGEYKLNMSKYQAGIYFLKLMNENKLITYKLILTE
ncbi:MAG: trypsin-like peptidase domain-containing protein [Bacteroidales bacterium]|nr:trypsin-like peptidase domain-containing protein [Bacteroidales bacterium]